MRSPFSETGAATASSKMAASPTPSSMGGRRFRPLKDHVRPARAGELPYQLPSSPKRRPERRRIWLHKRCRRRDSNPRHADHVSAALTS